MEELIKPNWHVALVHFPIGLIAVGAIIELLSFLGWRRSSLRAGGRWMLLAGAILAVPATFSGIYALADVAPEGIAALRASDPILGQELFNHLWMQSTATALAMLIVATWIGLSDHWRDRLSILFKVALVALVGLMTFASHIGGQQVYEHRLGTTVTTQPATMPTAGELKNVDTWAALFPPEQTHIVVAGFAMAAACVCIGLAARATHVEPLTATAADAQLAAVFAPPATASMGLVGDPYVPYVSPTNHTSPLRVGRVWGLAWMIVVLSSISGLAILAMREHTVDPNSLWGAITYRDTTDPQVTRRVAHAVAGTVIVVDTLILAILSRFARRGATVLAMFAFPLILALAAQIWFGVLLLLDGPAGPITRFVH